MINIKSLKKEDEGRWVVHDNGHGKRIGRIKSWGKFFIFVVYHCEEKWDKFQDYTGCATKPEDLTFTTVEDDM